MREPTGGRDSQLNGKLTIVARDDCAIITPKAAAVLLEMLQAATGSEAVPCQSLAQHRVKP